jgi:hypothetical protein
MEWTFPGNGQFVTHAQWSLNIRDLKCYLRNSTRTRRVLLIVALDAILMKGIALVAEKGLTKSAEAYLDSSCILLQEEEWLLYVLPLYRQLSGELQRPRIDAHPLAYLLSHVEFLKYIDQVNRSRKRRLTTVGDPPR